MSTDIIDRLDSMSGLRDADADTRDAAVAEIKRFRAALVQIARHTADGKPSLAALVARGVLKPSNPEAA